jgi:hypothetical protein
LIKRGRSWLAAGVEVVRALCADPWLLAPAVIVVVLAVVAAYAAWRFV